MIAEFEMPARLDTFTQHAVADFAAALAAKLRKSEEKYGYDHGWLTADWEEECRRHLREHLEKGDPLDVAAYCMFMWRRGWSTAERS